MLETFRGREAGTQKPLQDAHCNKGDHTGNAMENGRYRRDGEPDGL
ncbi:hypothetical protein SFK304_0776 [Shigella flexneri K-304]|nr:hypothetical protein SFy_0770 [Shigella flexneri 2003036]AIL39458.1 hypothetical protein SFyv_0811 [Shigella flexneri Shi06HN006]EFS14063.1 hypothetical protein SF2457T_1844 [Shigella flexneri 2a str. 2457T]EGJ91578.1 hypothetical protein SF274771_0706 [Shigella flexneri 2747-71]EGK40848.1 hypothetical protein SFK304_0776 [Shigella flexneri K-304]EIQ32254.1 hypothetical protein SFK404_0836 [Shigella flexneri K-404]